jgi:hypothetical protein
METEARQAGTNRWFMTASATWNTAFTGMKKEILGLVRKGYADDEVSRGVSALYHGAVGFLYNCPLDMLIEQRIRRDYPEIAEVQFCGVAQLAHDALTVTMRKDLRDFVPPTLQRINDALNGAYALFVDELFDHATDFAASYHPMPTFALSQKLHGMLKEANTSFRPGTEYELVDAFADQLGIRDWYSWKLDSGGA